MSSHDRGGPGAVTGADTTAELLVGVVRVRAIAEYVIPIHVVAQLENRAPHTRPVRAAV